MKKHLILNHIRRTTTLCLSLIIIGLLTGCNAIDSFTGDQSMRWVGHDLLSKKTKTVNNYDAVAMFPTLTPDQAAQQLGLTGQTSSTSTQANGPTWVVTVQQSPYQTTVQYHDKCGTLTTDPDKAIQAGKDAYVALGGKSDDWTWFTVTDKTKIPRAIAEPNLEGSQTWATATISVLVDDDGLCALNARLMGFKKTGDTTTLPSPYQTFQDARHDKNLAIPGDYTKYQNTWTLNNKGHLLPLWHFYSPDHNIVAVNFGDGLETALDTQSNLQANLNPKQ